MYDNESIERKRNRDQIVCTSCLKINYLLFLIQINLFVDVTLFTK